MNNQIKTKPRMKRIIIFLLVVMMICESGNGNQLYVMGASSEVGADANTDTADNVVSSDAGIGVDMPTDDVTKVTPSTYSGYQAISDINEIYPSGKRTKVGKYYYWIKSANKSFRVFRSKKQKGSGSVIFKHSNTQIHTKPMGEWAVDKYAYTGIYTNGSKLVFGEYNRKKKTLTLIKRDIKKKKNKKITTIKSGYFESYSGLGCCTLEAVYQNKCYIRKQREKGNKTDTFVINLKNGKKQKLKANISNGVFDGRYIYLKNGKKATAFDCKSKKTLAICTPGKDEDLKFITGEDGVYMVKDDESRHKTYAVRMRGNQEIDNIIDFAYTSSYYGNDVDKITNQYIYYQAYNGYNNKTSYKRYDRVSKESATLKRKVYNKEVDS